MLHLDHGSDYSWWRHQMETYSALLALCAGNSPVTGEFPSQRPVTRSFDVFSDMRLDKRSSKQWRRRWFETPSRSLCRHCNVKLCNHPHICYCHEHWSLCRSFYWQRETIGDSYYYLEFIWLTLSRNGVDPCVTKKLVSWQLMDKHSVFISWRHPYSRLSTIPFLMHLIDQWASSGGVMHGVIQQRVNLVICRISSSASKYDTISSFEIILQIDHLWVHFGP